MEEEYKYCWLNLHTGKFSASWGQKEMDIVNTDSKLLSEARQRGSVIIEYRCINDPEFEFYQQMKLK